MKSVITAMLLLWATQGIPQDNLPEPDLQIISDNLYGDQDLDLNYEDAYENIAQVLAEPLDLNKATPEALRFLNVLSEVQIQNLVRYRSAYGPFLAVYELQCIPELDLTAIRDLLPYVIVPDPTESIDQQAVHRMIHESKNYLLLRYERSLETPKGFQKTTPPEDRFKGSPDKTYVRFRSAKPGEFSMGFTGEKDAGEVMRWKPSEAQWGFDYFSFHAQLQNKKYLKNLILGDFQGQFGQGLVLGGLFGMGKGGETITTVRRTNIGFVPYTSVNEAGNWRGIATTLQLNKYLSVSIFYSRSKRDASFGTDDNDITISSFQTTGLHRTDKERSARKAIAEQNTGAVIAMQRGSWEAGLLLHRITFDKPYMRKPTPYNQFAFRGRSNTNAGCYVHYTLQNMVFFSEMAHSLFSGKAFVFGTLMSLSKQFDLSLLYRNYDRNYFTFYSGGFGEGSATQNERGMYWGWKYRFNRRWTATGYIDLFRFPWLRYRSYMPSQGHEWLFRLNYQPSRTATGSFQVREETKTRNLPGDKINTYETGEYIKRSYLIHFDYGIGQKLHMKTRALFNTFTVKNSSTKGFALIQDISIRTGKLQWTARYALFDTEDYENRLYAYEHDVWLSYSIPAYDGTGIRQYLLITYKMNKRISVWARYARTWFTDRDEIGNGPDKVIGNAKNDIKFEIRYQF